MEPSLIDYIKNLLALTGLLWWGWFILHLIDLWDTKHARKHGTNCLKNTHNSAQKTMTKKKDKPKWERLNTTEPVDETENERTSTSNQP